MDLAAIGNRRNKQFNQSRKDDVYGKETNREEKNLKSFTSKSASNKLICLISAVGVIYDCSAALLKLILSSLDGKINGPFMAADAARLLGGEYGKIRTEMNADAWLYGTTTVKEFLDFREPVLEENLHVPEGDFIAGDETKPYFVALDAKGELGCESGRFSNKGRAGTHVIEILTEAAPLSYRAYLRKRGISYILAGEKELNCEMAMKKLHRLFHIKKLLLCGGGVVNWTFLKAGMVDELSMVLSPVTDGSIGTASVFSQIPTHGAGEPVEFELKAIERIGNGGLHLNYLAENAKLDD